jgi:hypothetical protein
MRSARELRACVGDLEQQVVVEQHAQSVAESQVSESSAIIADYENQIVSCYMSSFLPSK